MHQHAVESDAITLPDGTRLPYAATGDAGGTPVVLLHGLSDSWRSWAEVLELLPRSIHAHALTLRGHGDADAPESGYELVELADDVAAAMDRLRLDRAVVVGHSLGAAVAARVAERHRERVAGLVLVGAFATPASNPGVAELAEMVSAFEDPVPREVIEEFQRSTITAPVSDELFEMVVTESAKLPVHVWKAATRGFVDGDHRGALASISARTMLIWGDQDAFVPRSDQDLFVTAMPRAELVVYEGVGHAVQWERPDMFAADLARFVAQLR